MLSKILSALGGAPKTLPQATETLGQAKATLDSVAALFTAAGLNLEQMLAAGPDSLKAHLDSLDNSDELAEALQENEKLSNEITEANGRLDVAGKRDQTFSALLASIGLPVASEANSESINTAFAAHVEKAATLKLASQGHPPAHIPKQEAVDDITPTKTDEDRAAAAALVEYEKLIVADNTAKTKASAQARTEFYAKNHALIGRGITLRKRS